MKIPNLNNGFVPKIGQKVRIIGGCHSRSLGRICEVTYVGKDENGIQWVETKWVENGYTYYSSGNIGGLELIE